MITTIAIVTIALNTKTLVSIFDDNAYDHFSQERTRIAPQIYQNMSTREKSLPAVAD